MSSEQRPDAEEIARSMLLLYGAHDDDGAHDDGAHDDGAHAGGALDYGDVTSWAKAPDFAADPQRAAAVHDATGRDRERYLTAGLVDVDCRFCHASVKVKKLGAPYTAVQWNSQASTRCAYFSEVRAGGGSSARVPSCPRLTDSIKHAVAKGCLEEYSSAPAPGDG